MANSASDARGSELEIRRKLIEDRSVDVIIAVGTNMFYTVTLPVTLWFLDRGKKHTDRADKVLFIDAREIYNQIDRAHRDWTPQHIEFLANIVRLWRDERPEFHCGSEEMLSAVFPNGEHADIAGICGVATIEQIEEQGWSLNPGRYVGRPIPSFDRRTFASSMEHLSLEFNKLTKQASLVEDRVRATLEVVLRGAAE